MNKVVFGLSIALVILVLLAVYRNSLEGTEKFVQEENNNDNKVVNFRLPMAEPHKSCKNDIKDKAFVSVAEFMAGERYKCY